MNFNLAADFQLKRIDQIMPTLVNGSESCNFDKLQLLEKVHLVFLRKSK